MRGGMRVKCMRTHNIDYLSSDPASLLRHPQSSELERTSQLTGAYDLFVLAVLPVTFLDDMSFFCFFSLSFSVFMPSSCHFFFTPASDLCFLGLVTTSPLAQHASSSLACALTSMMVSCLHLHSLELSTLHCLCILAVLVICEGLRSPVSSIQLMSWTPYAWTMDILQLVQFISRYLTCVIFPEKEHMQTIPNHPTTFRPHFCEVSCLRRSRH